MMAAAIIVNLVRFVVHLENSLICVCMSNFCDIKMLYLSDLSAGWLSKNSPSG